MDFRFIPQVSIEYALVDVLFTLMGLPGNGVKLLQESNIVGLSIVEVDGEKRNSARRKLVLKPGEGWHLGC